MGLFLRVVHFELLCSGGSIGGSGESLEPLFETKLFHFQVDI